MECFFGKRDRAEQEKQEERELHEREIADYKMKIHGLNSEVEKLTARLERAQVDRDRIEAKLESSQSELGIMLKGDKKQFEDKCSEERQTT